MKGIPFDIQYETVSERFILWGSLNKEQKEYIGTKLVVVAVLVYHRGQGKHTGKNTINLVQNNL